MKIKSASFVLGATAQKGMPGTGLPEVAFIGRSNVGKSSLLNMILGRKRLARTSGTPGKTQEINFYLINESLYFVDLPGFGYARISKARRADWQKLIGGYLISREPLRLICQLIDARHPPTVLDEEVMLLLKEASAAHIVLLTKADKLSGNQRVQAVARVASKLSSYHLEIPVVLTSAMTGRGRDEVHRWVQTLLA